MSKAPPKEPTTTIEPVNTSIVLKKITPLDIDEVAIRNVVKTSSVDDLHRVSKVLNFFKGIFDDAAKSRIKTLMIEGDQKALETETGKITLVTRNDVATDEEKLRSVLINNDLDESLCFTPEYVVISKNQTLLDELVKKGVLLKSYKFDYKAFVANVENSKTMPEEVLAACSNYIVKSETKYLKGF